MAKMYYGAGANVPNLYKKRMLFMDKSQSAKA